MWLYAVVGCKKILLHVVACFQSTVIKVLLDMCRCFLIQLNKCLITKPRRLYIGNVDDETEDGDDDLDENFHGDDTPASDCNVDEFDYSVSIYAFLTSLILFVCAILKCLR